MIFVDTGAWIARFSRRDQFHKQAKRLWAQAQSTGEQIVTSDAVFFETIALLARKIAPNAAAEAGSFLLGWQRLLILPSTAADEEAALDLLEKFADQKIGFVDSLSFALMRRKRIQTAFTFDRHFESAGFSMLGLAS
jgi:predicted nucleic acid-binding protein